jgi:phenylalanyl-tRNA synthetase beta chain
MKISLNWLRKYVDINIPNEELIRLIGARLVEVEGVIDETSKYDKIYVARVEKAEKIPDTHLTLCQINVGTASDSLVQVVCGAPNVREGMLVAWIAPGAIVPASVKEDAPFVIGKRKMLKKYESSGMLAGADELDFGDDHSGIVEIDPKEAKPGDLLADVFNLKDLILEIENKSLTHRPDCFGIIGFAREVAGIMGQKFNDPDFLFKEDTFKDLVLKQTKTGLESEDQKIDIEVSDSKICPRYSAAVLKIKDATEKEKYLTSMQVLLAKSGMNSISKIVDITNYIMLLTGQPLHAFDFDKFVKVGKNSSPKIAVRLAKNGEKMILLDDEEVELNENDIVIASGDTPVALAGAMGGKNTMVDDETKQILLESASLSLYNLRKTQMAHGIFSEAITRFTKGVPCGGTFNVLAEASKEIGGKPVAVKDYYMEPNLQPIVKITTKEINSLLGTNYDEKLIMDTLKNVGFEVQNDKSELTVIPKYWRTDIHIKEDIIEEVGRLLGYDNIIPTLPLHGTADINSMFALKHKIRDLMDKLGANELLTYSFVSGKLLEKANQDQSNSYKIVNSISPELQYVRQSIVPSLLDKAFLNEKLPVEQFAIYEMNKVYRKEWGRDEEDVPVEKNSLGFIIAERKKKETAYYAAKKYVARLLGEIGIVPEFLPLKNSNATLRPFDSNRSAEIVLKNKTIGVVGEFKNSVRASFKLAEYLAGFELDLDAVLQSAKLKKEIRPFSKKSEDITITTDTSYEETLKKVQKEHPGARIEPGTIYQGIGQKTKNMTFHLEFVE